MNPGDDRAVALARAEVWLRAVQEEDPDHVVPPTGIVTDLVDALRAGDRPVPPTREQVEHVLMNWLAETEMPWAPPVARLRDRLLALLSGGVPTEPEETT